MSSIKNLIKGTGSYIIDEISTPDSVLKSITTGTKVLRCTSAGTAAIQSKQAYGELEFDINKTSDPSQYRIYFNSNIISPDVNATSSVGNGYVFTFNSLESFELIKNNNGSPYTILSKSANSYISNNTWYRIKVARLQSEGVFKDIPTLQTSLINNTGVDIYETFTSNGRYGFSATSDGTGNSYASTADEISIINTAKYLIEFDLKLNSGTAPKIQLWDSVVRSSNYSLASDTVNGRNSIIITATGTTTGVVGFYNTSATNYTISGLTIRRIYPANTFAVFIKGGSFGDDWTLVDTTGGSGTNPVTDSTYTTSNYFVADLDQNDRLANLKIMNGVKQ